MTNEVICLVIVFTPKVSKIIHFLYFPLMPAKKQSQFGQMINCIWKISLNSFRKCYVSFGFELPLARCQSMERQDFLIFCRPSSFSDRSTLSTSQTVTPNLIDLTTFWKNLIRYFSSTLIFFCRYQQKIYISCIRV